MWRSRIFWRLFLSYTALLTFALGGLGWGLTYLLQAELDAAHRAALDHHARLAHSILTRMPVDRADWRSLSTELAEDIQGRVSLYDAKGTLLSDSDGQEDARISLEELQRTADQATSQNVVLATTGEQKLFLIRRVEHPGVGFVRLVIPLAQSPGQLTRMQQIIWGG
jgi:hypothetical protein